MSQDLEFSLRVARMNEAQGDWDAAIECLERAARVGGEHEGEVAALARGILAKLPRGSALVERARRLAVGAAPAASVVTPPSPPPAEKRRDPTTDDLATARALLVTPEVLRALRTALGKSEGSSSGDRPLVLPAESVLTKLVACELDLARVIELALDLLLEATGTSRGFMLVRDVAGRLTVAQARGLRPADLPPDLSRSILGEAERTGRPVITKDARRDPRFAHRESVQALEVRAVACIPIVDPAASGTALLGAIYLDGSSAAARLDDSAQTLLATLAETIAPRLRNARRFEAQRAALARAGAVAPATRVRLVGRSPAMARLLELLGKAAPSDVPVLILGESGTGKELAARFLHELSPRSAEPFVAENLGALSPSLVEAELFGVRKGAFTGADADRDGLFVRAGRGTVFLDEIGELPLESQAKLLRVLQEREVRPVGGSRAQRIEARVVAATNRDLDARVREGAFREDLLFRLNVFTVRTPPLRERPQDIPLLCEHILERIALERGEPVLPLSSESLGKLAAREWRGNVRELENVLWRVALSGERALEDPATPPPSSGPLGLQVTLPGATVPIDEARAAFDRSYLSLVLERNGRSISRSAEELGLSRPGLSRLLKKLGIRE